MGRDRAAYMREYRKRKAKARRAIDAIIAAGQTDEAALLEARQFATDYASLANDRAARIAELEAEVARLRALRPEPLTIAVTNAHDSDDVIRRAWSRSKPAPKPGSKNR